MKDQISIVTLSIDGVDVECVVLSVFKARQNTYVAVMSKRDIELENGIALLYRYEDIDEEPFMVLEDIEEDEEYDYAAYEFAAMFDDQRCSDVIDEYKKMLEKQSNGDGI